MGRKVSEFEDGFDDVSEEHEQDVPYDNCLDDEDYVEDDDIEYDDEELQELDGSFGYSDPADFEND